MLNLDEEEGMGIEGCLEVFDFVGIIVGIFCVWVLVL